MCFQKCNQKCKTASNIHVNCHLIRIDMDGMGSWPPCLWSSLSWLSGKLSKKFAGGFCQFAIRNQKFALFKNVPKDTTLFSHFPKIPKIHRFWYFQKTNNTTLNLHSNKAKNTKSTNYTKQKRIHNTYKNTKKRVILSRSLCK